MLSSSALRHVQGTHIYEPQNTVGPKPDHWRNNQAINAYFYISSKGIQSSVFKMVLLSGFQCDDYEDRASVHSTNTAGVTHKIVQDGCELCAHLLIGN